MKNNERWLAVDTDAGGDDAVALCLATRMSKFYGFKIKMISCVQGNTSLENVVVNVSKVNFIVTNEKSQQALHRMNSIYLHSFSLRIHC